MQSASKISRSIQIRWQSIPLLRNLSQKFIREVVAIELEHVIFVGPELLHDPRKHSIDHLNGFKFEVLDLDTLAEREHVVPLRTHLVHPCALNQCVASVCVFGAVDFDARVIDGQADPGKLQIVLERQDVVDVDVDAELLVHWGELMLLLHLFIFLLV